jgi:hypothetical protein
MVILQRLLKPAVATVVSTGAAIEIPAGTGGSFILRHGEPVFFYVGETLYEMTAEAFCAATGRQPDALRAFSFLDGDDEYVDDDVDDSDDDWDDEGQANHNRSVMRRMWIICEVDDYRCNKLVCNAIRRIAEEMSGQVLEFIALDDVVAVVRFPHRKCKGVEKAIAAALCTLPVKRTMVFPRNPYALRHSALAATLDLYRRQDEVIGLPPPPDPH